METLRSAEGRPAFTAAHTQEAESQLLENSAAPHINTEESDLHEQLHRFDSLSQFQTGEHCTFSGAQLQWITPTSLSFHLHKNMLLWFEQIIHGQKPVSHVISECNRIKSGWWSWWKIKSAQRNCARVWFKNQSSYKNRITALLPSLRGCRAQLKYKQKVPLFNQVEDSRPADSSFKNRATGKRTTNPGPYQLCHSRCFSEF